MSIEQRLIDAGWTPHLGGPCPVDPNSYPQTMDANGGVDCELASDGQWEHDPKYPQDTIIAYRDADKIW